ncbi:transcription factor Opi1-domain-containing protein [Aspergillus pseudoustus]|uniref:Transcription factor Opi1-domain-containing protein n=1 Tax=Aspergillus pseudoustus TaxID=1810923 RepID=A0ABR4K885_9EURO
MDHSGRSADGIATLNSSLSSVSVQDATANPPLAATPSLNNSSNSSSTSLIHLSNPPSASSTPQHVPSMMEVENAAVAEDRSRRATSVLSMDDLEAAQALEGLRTDFGASPRSSQQTTQSPETKPPPEPLLSLLTSSHPLISSAINGSVSAYTSSKSYSPRFKTGAEFIERNIGPRVANTVGNVTRKSGMESGIRWALQRHASTSSDSARSKRRKVSGHNHPTQQDLEKGLAATMDSNTAPDAPELYLNESLPPYDDEKTPNYDEVDRANTSRQSTWQSRLMISTSGLGVAMSEESLRSLQYCLTWLKWANGRLGKSIVSLQETLKEWEDLPQKNADGAPHDQPSNQTQLSQRVQALKQDILTTLKQVVDVVSKYAGGALPENARHLVRRHLTSLPQRFQMASTAVPEANGSSSEASSNARRILVLAQEGLDMMSQVSGVVNDTLVSAEHWCERLGRKRSEKNPNEVQPPREYPSDTKQPISDTQDTAMTGTEKV